MVPAIKRDRQKMETLYSTSDNLEPIKNVKSEFNLSREAVFFVLPYLHSESVKYLYFSNEQQKGKAGI